VKGVEGVVDLEAVVPLHFQLGFLTLQALHIQMMQEHLVPLHQGFLELITPVPYC
jgi:hypothetical protein